MFSARCTNPGLFKIFSSVLTSVFLWMSIFLDWIRTGLQFHVTMKKIIHIIFLPSKYIDLWDNYYVSSTYLLTYHVFCSYYKMTLWSGTKTIQHCNAHNTIVWKIKCVHSYIFELFSHNGQFWAWKEFVIINNLIRH